MSGDNNYHRIDSSCEEIQTEETEAHTRRHKPKRQKLISGSLTRQCEETKTENTEVYVRRHKCKARSSCAESQAEKTDVHTRSTRFVIRLDADGAACLDDVSLVRVDHAWTHVNRHAGFCRLASSKQLGAFVRLLQFGGWNSKSLRH